MWLTLNENDKLSPEVPLRFGATSPLHAPPSEIFLKDGEHTSNI